MADVYHLPQYARERLGRIAGVRWDKARRISGLNSYEGLVQNSFQVFENLPSFPNGLVFYESKFDIDQDGSGPKTPGDTSSPSTSLLDLSGKALNADRFPFAVLPLRSGNHLPSLQDFNLHLGDLGIAFWQDRVVPFVYGDLGPRLKIGEGSVFLAKQLGIPASPISGGIQDIPPGIIQIAFPMTRDRTDNKTARQPDRISQETLALLQKFMHQSTA